MKSTILLIFSAMILILTFVLPWALNELEKSQQEYNDLQDEKDRNSSGNED